MFNPKILLFLPFWFNFLTTTESQCTDRNPLLCQGSWRKYCAQFETVRNLCQKTCNTCPANPDQVCAIGPSLNEQEQQGFSSDSTDFALQLHKLARRVTGNADSVFFSPASISIALGMVLAGARGQTAEQISQILTPSLSRNKANQAYQWLMQALNQEPKDYQLYTANAMYIQKNLNLQDSFAQIVSQCFQSSAELRDFQTQAEQVRQEVNQWVERKTNDKIRDLLAPGSIHSLTRLILVNAIYFKAEWLNPFTDGAQTLDQIFYQLNDNMGKITKMMNKKSRFLYHEETDIKVLGLEYKERELTMFIFLPKSRDGLPQLEATLTPERIKALTSRTISQTVDVMIPKFKITQGLKLKPLLTTLGMGQMFSRIQADLSGIDGTRNLSVDDVIHKAFIEVNEKGTEAAAATAVLIQTYSAQIPSLTFRADHPFFFTIQHRNTDMPLFMGSLLAV